MEKIHKERLLKLAKHLREGKLGHEKFDFAKWNTGGPYSCGTLGCAIGECPIIFEDWIFGVSGSPVLSAFDRVDAFQQYISPEALSKALDPEKSGMEFFGLSGDEFRRMFVPYTDFGDSSRILSAGASKEEVAQGIENFVKEKYGGVSISEQLKEINS